MLVRQSRIKMKYFRIMNVLSAPGRKIQKHRDFKWNSKWTALEALGALKEMKAV